MINILLNAGVDPNHEMNFHRPNAPGRGRFGDNQLSTGTTALFRAVQLNDMESVQALLAKGASPNINSMGYSAWLLAAGAGPNGRGGNGGGTANMALIELLMQHNADVNAKVTGTRTYSFDVSYDRANAGTNSREGTSALHAAAQAGNVSLVKYLLDHGANPNVLDVDGKKPIDVVGVQRGGGGPGGAPAAAAPAQAKGKGGPAGAPGGNRGGANTAAIAEIRSLLESAAAKN